MSENLPPPPPPTYAAPPSTPRTGAAWRWGCGFGLAGCLLAVMFGLMLAIWALVASLGGLSGMEHGRERIALIRIDGVIMAGKSGFSVFGGAVTGSDDVVDQIEKAVEDSDAKAILLRINSPGGSAAGSQEIYAAVDRARSAGKVVVASMADVAASGGYYVAAPADVIFADPATITGSIGAIAVHQNMAELLDKIGIEAEIIKSGGLKDMLQPTGPLSDDARRVVTTLVNQVHSQFVDAVAQGRRMDRAEVLALADGRIYTGEQAVQNGLVDSLGGMSEALVEAGRRAGVKGKPRTKEYGAPSLLRWLIGGAAQPRAISISGGLLYDDFAARLAQGPFAVEPSATIQLRPAER